MEQYREIPVEELQFKPFTQISKDWMLITAEKDGKANTMTAGWGGLGTMWGKPVAFIVIRQSRFTKEFVDGAEHFSLTFFEDKYKKELGYLGKVSGRDEDKIAKTGLTLKSDDAPYFEEGNLALVCKKLYGTFLGADGFTVPELDEKWYADKDYHTLYIGEVEKVFVK
ncbi:MAG: flavin reductase [Eubacterium sp.]|nr:flavin reductase [Eubacterium sp.]